ncbi:MAG: integration host factor subunit alpha [Myxococcota bacterium]
MTKADIIDAVHAKMDGFTKREAADAVELVFEALKEGLARQDKVMISGFGNFMVHDKKARMGRNPKTNEPIEISAHRSLTFKPSPVIKRTMNT